MSPDSPFPDAPRELTTLQGGRPLVLRDDLVAVHSRPSGAQTTGAVLVLDHGRIAVFGAASVESTPAGAGPVYASLPFDGELAVPTGRVFVRFAPGTDAAARSADIERLGFLIERVPVSAPHAAWVVAPRGGIAAALKSCRSLERIPGVENVEPQLLRESVRR
jgi:hypothetical protein